jgi:hypothetical protein
MPVDATHELVARVVLRKDTQSRMTAAAALIRQRLLASPQRAKEVIDKLII